MVRAFCERVLFGSALLSDGILAATDECADSDAKDLLPTLQAFSAWQGTVARESVSSYERARTLLSVVCGVASFVGCHVKCRASGLSDCSDAFVFNVSAFEGIVLSLLLRARESALDRSAVVELFVRDGRIFVDVSAEMATGEATGLALCKEICQQKEFPFEVCQREGREVVCFSPEVCDVSLLGLKNRFLFE